MRGRSAIERVVVERVAMSIPNGAPTCNLSIDRTISGIGFQVVIANGDRLEAYPTSNPDTDCSVGPK